MHRGPYADLEDPDQPIDGAEILHLDLKLDNGTLFS